VGVRDIAALLARSCHLEPAGLVTVLTGVLALAAGVGPRVVWLVPAAAAGQLAVGWSNDYLDRGLDRAAGRTDKPLAAGDAGDAAAVRAAAIMALPAAAGLSLLVGLGFAVAHLGAVACALAYNAGLKRRPLSVLPYALAFGLLPVAVALALPGPGGGLHWAPVWAVAAGALVGAGGHFTQALPDIPSDRLQGVRGLPQVVGQRASASAAAGLLLAANLVIALAVEAPPLKPVHVAVAAALAAAIVGVVVRGRPRLSFRLTLASAALAVAALLAGGGRL
jgi:4-hydroxybenzoate polyprenyltransferase